MLEPSGLRLESCTPPISPCPECRAVEAWQISRCRNRAFPAGIGMHHVTKIPKPARWRIMPLSVPVPCCKCCSVQALWSTCPAFPSYRSCFCTSRSCHHTQAVSVARQSRTWTFHVLGPPAGGFVTIQALHSRTCACTISCSNFPAPSDVFQAQQGIKPPTVGVHPHYWIVKLFPNI